MNYQTYTLTNGMRIIHAHNHSPISYSGILINAGTRDELDNESGIAHFTEHMLFKGTKKRRAHHILNRMEDVGGELNAFTSKEETAIYTIFYEEYLERSMDLLADILFNSQFLEKQFERERIVILDEINSYLDTPSALIYDDFEQIVFNSHDLGKPILGTPESLKSITPEVMKAYVERQFRPEKMVFFSVGKTPFSKVIKKAEKHFNVHSTATSAKPKTRIAPLEIPVESIAIEKDTHQTHYVMGRKIYNMFHPNRATLYLLNSILGGLGMNSRLNNSLREKNGLVYTVESTHALYSDSGLFSIYFGCDPNNTKKCINLIHKEFRKLKQTPLTSLQLSKAKKQLKGELGIAFENKENMALDMAKSFLHFDRYINLTEVSKQIELVTAEQIQALAKEILCIDDFYKLHYT